MKLGAHKRGVSSGLLSKRAPAQFTGASSSPGPRLPPGTVAGGVDRIFIGSGARPPGKCPPGYRLTSAGPGQSKSWYCDRVVSTAPARRVAPPAPPPPPPDIQVTVSPTFQQDFNAQVSPAITAQIASPGASAVGAPSQQTSSKQDASGGSGGPTGPSASEIALREQVAAMEAEARVRQEYAAAAAQEFQATQQVPEAPPPIVLPAFTPSYAPSSGGGVPAAPSNIAPPPSLLKKLAIPAILVVAGIGAVFVLSSKSKRGTRRGKR